MRIRKILNQSKTTTAVLLVLVGTLSLIAAGAYTTRTKASSVRDSRGTTFKSFISELPLLRFLDGPTVTTDKADYPIGATVVIGGTGWQPGETVTLQVTDDLSATDPNHQAHAPWDVIADASGNISSSWVVDADADTLTLTLTATGHSSGATASTTFTDANPSASLAQCENGSPPSPSTDGCDADASDWGTGNLGGSKSFYREGDSIPYRLVFQNLTTGSGNTHSVTIEWDTTKSSKHAIDYITNFNRTVADADPCLGIPVGHGDPACGSPSTFAIPKDPQVDNGSGSPVSQIGGNFTIYGGTITSVSAPTSVGSTSCAGLTSGKYCYSTGTGFTGDKSAAITINFTASQSNPVLAWGGHIATRADWGLANSAIAISGSPYHTRLIDLDGSGGNQDRSLSAQAVFFPVQLTIVKETNPDKAPQATFTYNDTGADLPSSFTLTPPDGATPDSKVFNLNDGSTRTVTEADPGPLFSFTSLSCSSIDGGLGKSTPAISGRQVTIDPVEGEFITCTYVNTSINDTFGRIIVKKVTDPSPDTTMFTFNPTGFPGTSTFTSSFLLQNGDSKDSCGIGVNCLAPSATGYKVTETANSDYTTTQNCSSSEAGRPDSDPTVAIPLEGGETVTCTFTNHRKPKLTVIKHVINDNGGTKTASDFTMHVKTGGADITGSPSAGSESGTTYTLSPGTFVVSENTPPTGYTQTGISGDCDPSTGSVTLANGDNKTCTITNDDQQAYIIVNKVVNNNHGGTAKPDDFKLTLGGHATTSGTKVAVNPGSYTAAETLLSGYTFDGFSGDCDSSGKTTVALGETKTCTLTNSDKQSYIIVNKVVNNNHGGTAKPDDFKLTLAGNATTSGAKVPVNPGSYTAAETLLAGYTFDGFSGDCDLSGKTTVALGETKTCTLTNSDKQAFIIVNKVVNNNHGGTAKPDDFKLTLAGNATTSGTKVAVNPGSYTAAETLLAGYTFDGFSGDCDSSGKTTVALGETKTCTLSNSDQQAYIIVNKVVNNNHGGTAKPDDFKLTLAGNATTSGTKVGVNPGSYTAAETLLSGYTFDGFSGDCDSSGKTTVALGETKSCTLTNSDQQAYIIVNKVVNNNHGGTAKPDDFKLTLGGNATTSGTKVPVNPGSYTAGETLLNGYAFDGFSGDCDSSGKTTVALGETKSCTLTNHDLQAYIIVNKVVNNNHGGTAQPDDFKLTLAGNATTSGTKVPVNPGSYTAGETLLNGYAFDGFSGDCDSSGKTTVALGETKTCTLTNHDLQAYIIVNKVVNNNHGGTAKPDDFKLTLGGNATTSGTKVAVNPGSYTAAETLLTGYTFDGFSGDCDSNGKTTVALGETKSCTLTNSDQQAYIIVNKVVNNNHGGTAQPDDFKLTLAGNATTSGTKVPVNPGSYTAAETLLVGYTFTGFSGDCDSSGKTTVALGETKTCTLTNSDKQAYIIVNKVVNNNHGGTAGPNDFKLTLGGNATTSGTKVAVNPGSYTAGETQLSGYAFDGFSGDCDSSGKTTVALGETKSCTLTNHDLQAYITVNKVVNNTHGGIAKPDDFKLTLGGNTTTSGTKVAVNPGSYTAGETLLYGYAFDGFSGDCDSTGKTTVALGQSKVCTLTNHDLPGTIKIIKNADPQTGVFTFDTIGTTSGSGTSWPTSFTLTGSTTGGGNMKSFTVDAGSYSATERTQLGWLLTGIGGSTDPNTPYNCVVSGSGGSTGVGIPGDRKVNITIFGGDTVTCTFENTGNGATRTQGFWATHPNLAITAWNGGTSATDPAHTFPGVANVPGIGDKLLCGKPVVFPDLVTANSSDVMGGFWSGISSTSTGGKRSKTDQSRMQLLQQLLAAELNMSAFGSAPASGSVSAWEAAYCSGNASDLQTAQQQAASYNTKGDSSTFTPGTSANSQLGRFLANYKRWDLLP